MTHATRDGDRLIATRYVDAELALVWEVFTTPEHLAAFWGGDHATVPPESVAVDLRVGGTFELATVGADGRSGTTVVVHQRRLPPELQTEQARTGLTGILERLNVVLGELKGNERRSRT